MAMEAAHRSEVGQRIKELRGPLPQPELARKLDVSLRAVQKWEAGESAPQWDNLVRLSKFFGVTQDYLLYGERSRTPEPSQLDRIEARLEEIISLLVGGGPADVLEAEADRLDAKRRQDAAARPRRQASRRAS